MNRLLAVALFFAAAPASGQRLMPAPAVPTLPVPAVPMRIAPLAPLGAPALSSPALPRLQMPPLAVPPQVREALSRPVLTVPQGLVRQAGAEASFAEQIRAVLAESVPRGMLLDIQGHGYAVLVKDHLTQDRPDLADFLDYTGGVTDWGPKGDFIMIAQRMKKDGPEGTVWIENLNWRNAAVHECGHALDNINGFTDSDQFISAWEADVAAMPDAVKQPFLRDGRRNEFYYFINAERPRYARRETFAEGFDILLRGAASSFNHDYFERHFSRTLAVMRRLLEARYGPIVVESPHES